ncbi:MAG TPA: RsmD family RNA methyltransferase [Alphaproteobacteria bacterium]|nr:RsmD family RNA methyltransferase [Alphaproteobacteria bacterium]
MPPAKKPASNFETRISAGSLKGKKIALPADEAARPTRLRLRQSVFNMLNSRIDMPGKTVVDICCGSGALGLEACSWGAAQVTMVDTKTALAKENVDTLGVGITVRVVQADARTWTPAAPFDVVLADPPYNSGMVQDLLARAAAIGKPGAWWVVELGADEALDWTGFADTLERTYGVSKIGIGRQL